MIYGRGPEYRLLERKVTIPEKGPFDIDVNLLRINIKPHHPIPGPTKRAQQRKADIAQADDADYGGMIFDLGLQVHESVQ